MSNAHNEEDLIFYNKLNEIINQNVSTDDEFIDDLFPPNEDSIGFNNIYSSINYNNKLLQKSKYLTKSSSKFYQNNIDWKRIRHINPNFTICSLPSNKKNYLDDVLQGKLGDCYFLSALNAIAEFPDRIKNIFAIDNKITSNKNNNNANVLHAKCYINGEEKIIYVDDYFPVEKSIDSDNSGNNEDSSSLTQSLCFSKINSDSNNIWPLILEKIWAKINTSYNSIINGNVFNAFLFLTPAPIEVYYHDYEKSIASVNNNGNSNNSLKCDLFSKLQLADRLNQIICCDITDKPYDNKFSELTDLGLLTSHAYSVVSIHVLTNTGTKLLKIRNPWGSFEWNGAWSDDSKELTPQIMKELNYDKQRNNDDGFFFIEYSDYLKFFTTTYICKVNDKRDYKVLSCNNNKYFELDFKEKQDCSVIVNLKNSKLVDSYLKDLKGENCSSVFHNKLCSLVILKKEVIDKNKEVFQYSYHSSTSSRLDRISLEIKDAEGKYVVEVCFPNTYNSDLDFSLESNTNSSLNEVFSTFNENRKVRGKISFKLGLYAERLDRIDIKELELNLHDESKKELNTSISDITDIINNTHNHESSESKDDVFTIRDYAEAIYNFADRSKDKNYFFQDSEPTTWRALVFEEDEDSFGALVYRNQSNALLVEYLEIKELNNLVIIPFDSFKLKEDSIFFENKNIETLYNKAYEIEKNEYYKETTEKISSNKYLFKIPPNTVKVFLIMKTEEIASLSVSAVSQLLYPTHFILRGNKFHTISKRLIYKNDSQIDIIHSLIRHSNGVLFMFSNKTKEFKITASLILEGVVNLDLNSSFNERFLNSSGLKESLNVKKDSDIRTKKNNLVVNFSLFPEEVVFFDFRTIKRNLNYEFSVKLDYKISMTEEHISKLLEHK